MKIKKKHVVLASLVLALGAAVYINWQMSSVPENKGAKELGKATYVNSNVNATQDEVNSYAVSKLSKEQQNYFSTARLNRDKTADEVKKIAMEALSLSESDEDTKEIALANLAELEKTIMSQVSVENVLTAKGFSACICSISDGSVTVIVPDNEMNDNSSLIIKDAVKDAFDIPFDAISIVTV